MKISHKWLKQLIDVRLKPAELAEQLSMVGLEIEGYESLGSKYEKFVVGQVLEVAKHPNADKLTLCKVNVGKEVLEIVCGAPNVASGQKVAVALVGATIPHNQHDPEGKPFVIQKATIRGIESNGMICSVYELDMGTDKNGILVLDPKAKVGSSLSSYLGLNDVIYEIEITANRGDWLSHLGVAREAAALTGKKVKLPALRLKESSVPTSSVASVKIFDSKKCRRYSARVLRGIKVGPSPKWLRDILTAVGLRPINNIVDVTNYVMLELGQPLHAFDYDRLVDGRIEVKTAAEGQTFTTLDGKTHTLSSDVLMICDAERPVAIGGVMGGANSEISNSTTNVLLESANFDSTNIRRTVKSLGISTDASQRFERSVDIEMTVYAVNRAAQLLQEITGAEVLRGVIDVYLRKFKSRLITLRVSKTNDILGTNLGSAQIASQLKRLGLAIKRQSKGSILVGVPSFRNDLVEEIDLIEEVARMFGYNNIETKTTSVVEYSTTPVEENIHDLLRAYFVGAGFNEIVANTLQDAETARLAGEPLVEVLNPVSAEMAVMRSSMIPGVLQIVRRNIFQGNQDLRLFELGRVYSMREGGSTEKWEDFIEDDRLLILLSGRLNPPQYGLDSRRVDIFDLKGEVESMLAKFHLDKHRLISYDSDKALTVDNVAVEIQGTYAGFFGKVKKEILQRFEIDSDVYVAELRVGILAAHRVTARRFEPLPRFPIVDRDVAFVVDEGVPQEKVYRAIQEAGGAWLVETRLFDVYTGQQIVSGKKSLAYSLKFQSIERTLTDGEINEQIARIVENVRTKCGGELRR
ncbi:MAG TPA: phenylalanine--tRNA ligase subunit beta [Bacteroidota bacterium]|nr:phenylalanine--tRNA ligase subunit beta [Bacteroidota bacterium]